MRRVREVRLRRGSVPRRWLLLLVAVGGAAAITALAPLAPLVTDGRISALQLLEDPAEVVGIPWYVGAIATVNLLVWAAGAALYLVAGAGTRRHDRAQGAGPRLSNGLLWLGSLTVLVLLDDRFLLHEVVVPWIFGLPQLVTFGLYGVALVLILARYHRSLLSQPESALLALGIVALGSSIALDVVGWDSTMRRVAEEGAKLLGAMLWSVYPAGLLLRWLTPPAARVEATPH